MSRTAKWLIALGFFAVGAVFLLGLGFLGVVQTLAGFPEMGSAKGQPHLAQYTLAGPIFDSEESLRILEEIEEDSECKGLLLRVESPGGAVGASQEIFHALRRLKERKSIPLWVSLGNVAASGGYYVALAGDTVFANPGTLTGSIGVIAQFPEAEGLLKKVGVGIQTVKSGEFKDVGGFARKASSEELAYLQDVIDDSHGQFVGDVALGRGLDSVEVALWADGRVFTGRQAKELGLVDTLGGWDVARRDLEAATGLGDEAEWVEYPKPRNPWIEWMDGGMAKAPLGASLVKEWAEQLGLGSSLASGLFFLWR